MARAGELGFKVLVGGGMGRTPVIATTIREFLPWNQIMNYLEAVVRVYNRWGRRDNMYKARIKILVKAEGQRYIDEVEAEYRQIIDHDGAPHTITQAELDRVRASFVPPACTVNARGRPAKVSQILRAAAEHDVEFSRWLKQNVAPHKNPTCAPSRCRSSAWARLRAMPRPTSSTLPPTWPRPSAPARCA
jgi:sulfite reductase (NADPH) hemoprotein beta-component